MSSRASCGGEFGFSELRNGNLPLWNPHIYLGIPFLGGFQSALLYPPNWLYLVAPVGPATNWLIAGHIFLSGVFMCLWTWRRGLHPVACLVAGALLMFCGPQFLRVQAGHLPVLLAMPWVPLLFLAIDEYFAARRLGWVLLGMGALAMEILAGHPQYFFYTILAAAIYSSLLMFHARERTPITIGLVGMVVGAFALTAAQLAPGLEAAGESIRSVSLPYKIASSFSLPPENLITLAVPGFFGDGLHVSYWGRWNMAESSVYVGACGLVLALYGAVYGERSLRRFSISMILILLLLALGNSTPLFQLLYDYAPNFDKLRSISRFAYLAAVFLCMLAGIGLDQLIRRPARRARLGRRRSRGRWGAGHCSRGDLLRHGRSDSGAVVDQVGAKDRGHARNLDCACALRGPGFDLSVRSIRRAQPGSRGVCFVRAGGAAGEIAPRLRASTAWPFWRCLRYSRSPGRRATPSSFQLRTTRKSTTF